MTEVTMKKAEFNKLLNNISLLSVSEREALINTLRDLCTKADLQIEL